MIFYHGTTTNIKVNKVLLPPNETGVLREDFRKNLGEGIVYTVKPDYYSLIKKGTEYICDKAFIKSFEKI